MLKINTNIIEMSAEHEIIDGISTCSSSSSNSYLVKKRCPSMLMLSEDAIKLKESLGCKRKCSKLFRPYDGNKSDVYQSLLQDEVGRKRARHKHEALSQSSKHFNESANNLFPNYTTHGNTPEITDWDIKGKVTLWQFLLQLLVDQRYSDIIHWTNNCGEFVLLHAEEVARLWGIRKDNNNRMNYDKLSRALRYYYQKNIIRKVHGHKFVYQFIGLDEVIESEVYTNDDSVPHSQSMGRTNKCGTTEFINRPINPCRNVETSNSEGRFISAESNTPSVSRLSPTNISYSQPSPPTWDHSTLILGLDNQLCIQQNVRQKCFENPRNRQASDIDAAHQTYTDLLAAQRADEDIMSNSKLKQGSSHELRFWDQVVSFACKEIVRRFMQNKCDKREFQNTPPGLSPRNSDSTAAKIRIFERSQSPNCNCSCHSDREVENGLKNEVKASSEYTNRSNFDELTADIEGHESQQNWIESITKSGNVDRSCNIASSDNIASLHLHHQRHVANMNQFQELIQLQKSNPYGYETVSKSEINMESAQKLNKVNSVITDTLNHTVEATLNRNHFQIKQNCIGMQIQKEIFHKWLSILSGGNRQFLPDASIIHMIANEDGVESISSNEITEHNVNLNKDVLMTRIPLKGH